MVATEISLLARGCLELAMWSQNFFLYMTVCF